MNDDGYASVVDDDDQFIIGLHRTSPTSSSGLRSSRSSSLSVIIITERSLHTCTCRWSSFPVWNELPRHVTWLTSTQSGPVSFLQSSKQDLSFRPLLSSLSVWHWNGMCYVPMCRYETTQSLLSVCSACGATAVIIGQIALVRPTYFCCKSITLYFLKHNLTTKHITAHLYCIGKST